MASPCSALAEVAVDTATKQMGAVGKTAYDKTAALEIERRMVVEQAVLMHTMIPKALEGRAEMLYYCYSSRTQIGRMILALRRDHVVERPCGKADLKEGVEVEDTTFAVEPAPAWNTGVARHFRMPAVLVHLPICSTELMVVEVAMAVM